MRKADQIRRLRLPPLERGENRGTWFVMVTHVDVSIWIFCPACRVPNGLAKHRIDSKGRVLEPWRCHVPDCRASANLVLVDYDSNEVHPLCYPKE